MKILIVGDWHSDVHEETAYQALRRLGHDVARFSWHEYFKPSGLLASSLLAPAFKFQNKYMLGPTVGKLNADLIRRVSIERPDAVFIYRGSHIYPETLRRLREVNEQGVLVGYNNDDPFSSHYPRWVWRHFLAGIPAYDLVFAYRLANLEELERAGAKRVGLLRSWYVPERNRPMSLAPEDRERYGCDVTFVGHYEDDGRIDYLREIVRLGFRLKLWGPGYEWDSVVRRIPELRDQAPVNLVWGEDYCRAIASAKVALCFLSKLNRDTYTRRCFEIPAAGTLLLSEYSEDLASLFAEGVDAEYFRSMEQFRHKLRRYLVEAELARTRVAKAGLLRVSRDGHDVVSRMRDVVRRIEEVRSCHAPLKERGGACVG